MINLDDFTEEYADAIKAADTYLKRSKRGIPPDRWATGYLGAKAVAKGIEGYQAILQAQTAALEVMHEELEDYRKRVVENMGVTE